jgi:hypothetical protein
MATGNVFARACGAMRARWHSHHCPLYSASLAHDLGVQAAGLDELLVTIATDLSTLINNSSQSIISVAHGAIRTLPRTDYTSPYPSATLQIFCRKAPARTGSV